MRLTAGAFTHEGQRRDNNQDSHVIDERLTLFAVADGMGGHAAGEVASQTAIESLRASVASGHPINDAITGANAAVIDLASRNPAYAGMGTTMTAAVVAGGRRLLIGHVGDSRAYLLHDGSLHRVTEDHSLVEELVRDGRLTPEQAESHPQRAIVTRALGIETDVDVDIYIVEVVAGDRLLICSDGLTTMVRERDVERVALSIDDPQLAAEALVDEANRAGGEDNITVIVVDVLEVDDDATPDPDWLAAAAPQVPPAFASAPDVEPEPEPPARAPRARRVRSVLYVVVPLVAIASISALVLGWYARNSYYVGVDDGVVVLYQGVPGGVLGWNPTVERRTDVDVDDLEPVVRSAVLDGAARGSREKAERYLTTLEARSTSTTTTTRVTTTTLPAITTTTTLALAPTVSP